MASSGSDPEEEWVTAEEYYQRGGKSDVQISHGMCPDCHAEFPVS